MRVFTASLATETNTFSPIPTDRASFDLAFYAPPGQHPATPTLCTAAMVSLRQRARQEKLTVIEGTAAWAEPGGTVQRATYEELRDEILAQLETALPVDAVVLGLHGAMVAVGYDDCEGDLLARTRNIVGPDVIIAASLDPHSHLTRKRVSAANILAAFQEFPHTDFVERGEHVANLALKAVRGEIKPRISTYDCRMIDVFPTNREPMRGFVDRLKALEGHNGVLSVSFIHGFMAADVPEMGAQILVMTDNRQDEGDALAAKLGQELYAMRGTTSMPMASIDDGLDQALAIRAKDTKRPVVIADVWDNPGGGVPGDGTHILKRMIARGLDRIGVATIWDPIAVQFCKGSGVGAVVPLRIGGKSGAAAGDPIDIVAEVRHVEDDGWQSFGASRVPLGPIAVVRVAGTEIDIILNTNRAQTFEHNIFSNAGIDPRAKDILLVKSTNHFSASFSQIASELIYIDAPNYYPSDPRKTVYRKLDRPLWPQPGVV
jgi:microcystin degradation protein MlrC